MERHCREINDIRAALAWSFSPEGDVTTGIALTAAYAPVWVHLSLLTECREHLQLALDAVSTAESLNPGLRVQLYIALAVALFETTGSTDQSERIFADALRIAQDSGNLDSQQRAVWGMCMSNIYQGKIVEWIALSERLLTLSQRKGDLADILVAERLKGAALHWLGRHPEAQHYTARVLKLYVPPSDQQHARWFLYDQNLLARTMLVRVFWLQGLVGEAMRIAASVVDEASSVDHIPALCYALGIGICPAALAIGDDPMADRSLAILKTHALKHNLTLWSKVVPCLEGIRHIRRGDPEHGVQLLNAALEDFRDLGIAVYFLTLIPDLAEGLGQLGLRPDGIALIDAAFQKYDHAGVRWCLPEMLRVKAELLLRDPAANRWPEAEKLFSQSIALAQDQGALFWELKAATSLAKLRIAQRQEKSAATVLRGVLDQICEHAAFSDLNAARSGPCVIVSLRK